MHSSDLLRTRTADPVGLSVVIPAFNEELRLPSTLLKTVDFLEKSAENINVDSYEILVVDDGSKDQTCQVVQQFSSLNSQVYCLSLPENKGKGEAVKQGVLKANGELVLFMDADGATPIQELERLLLPIRSGYDLAFGSRALSDTETKVKTVWYRKFMGRVFNLLVNIILLPGVQDTQCGFKIFTKDCAAKLFSKQTLPGFGFDVEILYLARKLGFKSQEIAVNWVNIPGSKVQLIQHSLKMFLELIQIRLVHCRSKKD